MIMAYIVCGNLALLSLRYYMVVRQKKLALLTCFEKKRKRGRIGILHSAIMIDLISWTSIGATI